MENKTNLILEVKNLQKHFPIEKSFLGKTLSTLKAVDNVSFKLEKGKTIGVVGESGCGKTTLGRTILQLYDTTGGKSLYYGHTIYEFMPKYYIDALKKCSLNIQNINKITKEFLDCYEKMDVSYSGLKEVLEDHLDTLELHNSGEEVLDTDHDKDYIDQTTREIKKLKLLIELIDNTAPYVGGLMLSNENVGELLLRKLYVENKIFKNTIEENKDELNKELEQIENEISVLKQPLLNDKAFNELESMLETGLNLALLTKSEMRRLRTEIQLIFQDPYSSLPPRMTVGEILSEAVRVHNIVPKEEVNAHIHKIMKMCGLQPQYYDRYPHEFSGGQRQRICIARALAVNPKLVICDEPVSALDVSIQAQIINLLKQLQNELGLTYMFISHDLSVVKYITDSIMVMYLGNVMEHGETDDIFNNPLHPYTEALFSAVPVPDPDAKMNRIILGGDIPSPANPPKGCKFHTRCSKCMSACQLVVPKFIEHTPNHFVACHLYNEEIMNQMDTYNAILKSSLEQEKDNEK